MSLANPFQFLIDNYFMEDPYYYTDTLFTCTSFITRQEFRIWKIDNGGFRVGLKVHHHEKPVWATLMTVANIQSVLGIVDDCEEKWMKQQKNQKKNR